MLWFLPKNVQALIQHDGSLLTNGFGFGAIDALGAQVDQQQMVVLVPNRA